jgi:hypothetical protein
MAEIYKMAENITRVNESEKAVAEGFAELSKLLNAIEDLKNQARAIWKGIETQISELNKLGVQ